MDKKILSHVAGVLDARGSINWQRSIQRGKEYKYPMVRIAVVEKRYELIKYLYDTFGGCISNCDKDGYRRFWQISGKSAKEFLLVVKPFLKTKRKLQEVKTVLDEN